MIVKGDLKVRVVSRRGNQGSEKILPEILVGATEHGEAWARDNGNNGIKIYPEDANATGHELSKVTMTWSRNFQSEFNPSIEKDDIHTVKRYISELLQSDLVKMRVNSIQPGEKKRKVESDEEAAALRKKKGSLLNTKQAKLKAKRDVQDHANMIKDSEIDDDEIIAQYVDSEVVPDTETAAIVGRAQGRAVLNGTPIPAEDIIEMKEVALRANISPWLTQRYILFVWSRPNLRHLLGRPEPWQEAPAGTVVITSRSPLATEQTGLDATDVPSWQVTMKRFEESCKAFREAPALKEIRALFKQDTDSTPNLPRLPDRPRPSHEAPAGTVATTPRFPLATEQTGLDATDVPSWQVTMKRFEESCKAFREAPALKEIRALFKQDIDDIDHATHDRSINHPTEAGMVDHTTHDHTSHLPTHASMIDHTTHEHRIDHATNSLIDPAEGQGVSSEGIIRTVLRVSTSNNPTKAPMNILLGNCRDVEEFYSQILSQCTTSANKLHEVSAVFTWNRRGNLIRKGNHDDWSFFYKDLQTSWKRDVKKFIDGICEIEIMLHVEN